MSTTSAQSRLTSALAALRSREVNDFEVPLCVPMPLSRGCSSSAALWSARPVSLWRAALSLPPGPAVPYPLTELILSAVLWFLSGVVPSEDLAMTGFCWGTLSSFHMCVTTEALGQGHGVWSGAVVDRAPDGQTVLV